MENDRDVSGAGAHCDDRQWDVYPAEPPVSYTHLDVYKRQISNIVAIDYDPGASEVNQLNRIKLMLSSAEKNLAAGRTDALKMCIRDRLTLPLSRPKGNLCWYLPAIPCSSSGRQHRKAGKAFPSRNTWSII